MSTDDIPEDLTKAIAILPPHGLDKLDNLRKKIARVRELRMFVAEYGEKIKEANKEINELTFRTLPDLFIDAKMKAFSLDADGDLPAFDAKMRPYYRAVIRTDWEDEQKDRAFALLQEKNAGDLIKTFIKIQLDREELTIALKIAEMLRNLGVAFTQEMNVHHMTLTSWVKEQYEKNTNYFSSKDLEAIGGQITNIVEVEPHETTPNMKRRKHG